MKIKLLLILLMLSIIQFFLSPYKDKIKSSKQEIHIDSGSYFIGNNNEKDNKPLRKMYFKGYFMDVHPVTNKQYLAFLRESGYILKGSLSVLYANKHPNFPAANILYEDAEAYAKFYNKRLPTEWEWEIAARSLKKELPFKSKHLNPKNRGNFYDNRKFSKVVICSYPPNDLGLYGMAGNVYEWTSSMYENKNIFGKYHYNHKVMVLRGGAWTSRSSDINATSRTPFPAKKELNWISFRCVRDN